MCFRILGIPGIVGTPLRVSNSAKYVPSMRSDDGIGAHSDPADDAIGCVSTVVDTAAASSRIGGRPALRGRRETPARYPIHERRTSVAGHPPMIRFTPDSMRTRNLRFRRPMNGGRSDNDGNDFRRGNPSVALHLPTDTCQTDPGLALVAEAWARLPEAVRAGIVALVKATPLK